MVPAPWVNQIEGPQMAGNYPGKTCQHSRSRPGPAISTRSPAFANAQLEISEQGSPAQAIRRSEPAF